MEGTREDVLKSINDWTMDYNAPNILWLKGHPGVGKSAIAAQVVEQLSTLRRLGSSFSFQRQNAAILTPHALWCTVAYDFARRHPTARRIMIAKLEEEEFHLVTNNIEMLFRHFIHEPLLGSVDIPTARSPVVVIDALDECGGLEGQNSTHRRQLIETLRNWSRLPGKFKLVVTSRGENDIERLFSATSHHPIEISAGQTVNARSSSDIRIFLTERFRQIAERYPRSLSPTWPGPQIVNKLTERAAGLFIWAETVVKFITLGEPQRRLKLVFEDGEAGDIDELYKQVLSNVFQRPRKNDIDDLRSIVGTIIFAKAPLSFSSLAQLLSANTSTVEHICNALQSILDSTRMLQFHHQSFVDFMLNKDKCPQEYLIDPHDQHHSLVLACLQTMRDNLRFNICNIESSYLRNDDIPDLASRADKHIPLHLFYSSCWWASHLSEIEFDVTTLGRLQFFTRNQFLAWLEVLSIKKQVNLASQMLLSLIRWIPVSSYSCDIGCYTVSLRYYTSRIARMTR
jgi:NACHT domain